MKPDPIPYSHIRQVLSLHATVTPDAPFLITYDGLDQRAEWTFAAFNGRVHQAAGFLYDDLGVRRTSRVLVQVEHSADHVILVFACWLIGAAVVPLRPDDVIGEVVHAKINPAAAAFVRRDDPALVEALSAAGVRQIVRLNGASDQHMVFTDEIPNRPNTFISTRERASSGDEALHLYAGSHETYTFTQIFLTESALDFARQHMFTGNQRLMVALPLTRLSIIPALITPLVVGGSLVLSVNSAPETFWGRAAREHVQIALLDTDLLAGLLAFADAQAEGGASIWGEGVGAWDLRRFRCVAGANLSSDLTARFNARFNKPVVTFDRFADLSFEEVSFT
ncbi:MAG: acyl--CoA ligase [Anaerolinea sp.]|nr:acyl--CoA ligase [Anaerolinea sp.]